MMLGEPGASGRDTAAITLQARLGRELVVGTRAAEVDRGCRRFPRVDGGRQLPTDLRSLRLGAGLEQSRSSGRRFDFGPIRLLRVVQWSMLGSRVGGGAEARIEVSARGAGDFGRGRGAQAGGGGGSGSFVLFPSLGASALREPFPRIFVVVVVAVARRFRLYGVRHCWLGMDEVQGRGAKIGLAAELLRIKRGSARVARVLATRSIIVTVDTSGAGTDEVRGGTAPLSERRRWRRMMIVALERDEREIKGTRGHLLASFFFSFRLLLTDTLYLGEIAGRGEGRRSAAADRSTVVYDAPIVGGAQPLARRLGKDFPRGARLRPVSRQLSRERLGPSVMTVRSVHRPVRAHGSDDLLFPGAASIVAHLGANPPRRDHYG